MCTTLLKPGQLHCTCTPIYLRSFEGRTDIKTGPIMSNVHTIFHIITVPAGSHNHKTVSLTKVHKNVKDVCLKLDINSIL